MTFLYSRTESIPRQDYNVCVIYELQGILAFNAIHYGWNLLQAEVYPCFSQLHKELKLKGARFPSDLIMSDLWARRRTK